jgi:hypothetical protein
MLPQTQKTIYHRGMSEVLEGAAAVGAQQAFTVGSTLLNNLEEHVRRTLWGDEPVSSMMKTVQCTDELQCPNTNRHAFTFYTCDPALYQDPNECDFDVPTRFLEELTFMRRLVSSLGSLRPLVPLPETDQVRIVARTRYTLSGSDTVLRRQNSLTARDRTGRYHLITEFNRIAGVNDEGHDSDEGHDIAHLEMIARIIKDDLPRIS